MGEIIKTIKTISLGKNKFDIELNRSTSKSFCHDIHIQSDKFRLVVPEDEFLPMLACIILAKKQFDIIKGIIHD